MQRHSACSVHVDEEDQNRVGIEKSVDYRHSVSCMNTNLSFSFFLWLVLTLALSGCDHFSRKSFLPVNEEPLTITACFMRYACGVDNDDMKVISVQDSAFQYLTGTDIDPEMDEGSAKISGWLYDNYTEKSGYGYSLTGYVGKTTSSGCDFNTPRFRIIHIERIDGRKFDKSGSSY